jgi:hypothetical protein
MGGKRAARWSAIPRTELTGEVTLPAERITPAASGGDNSTLDYAKALAAASRRAPLEAWLAAGCVLVVLWAVGWL